MTQFRQDPILKQWVIVHTDDSWSPDQYPKQDNALWQKNTCQFCPGKESMTPPEIDVVREAHSHANKPGWQARVVSNKFPALRIEGTIDEQKEGIFDFSNGIGAHEVLIENSDHNKKLADFSLEEMTSVIHLYQRRLMDLTNDKRFKYIIIFKNYGESAGATVEHTHSQIIALPMVPQYVLQELEGTKAYYEKHKRCIFCDMILQEQKDTERIVTENDDFMAFCPFVSRYPFECWIIPKRHTSAFEDVAGGELQSFAEILKDALRRLKVCLSDPAYNYYLHISPINYEPKESFHWHVEIVPRLLPNSGFEWGTGFYVLRTDPAKAAQYLRNAAIELKI